MNSKKFNDPYSLDLARVRKSELGDRRESLELGKAEFLECNSSDAVEMVIEWASRRLLLFYGFGN